MADNELSKEVKEKLELARSKVRRRLSYAAMGLFATIVLWGTMWMGDRTIAIVGLNLCSNLIVFWFVLRGMKPPPEIK